ncbi:ATP-binding protein [Achromobacter xylosoxidans]
MGNADALPIDADVPRPFTGDQLLRSVEANAELMGVSEYVETMLMRIRTILSDSRMRNIISGTDDLELYEWLTNYIGDSEASNGSVTVIDLSLVPAEVVHIITAVIARMTLESLQRYRKLNAGKTLPTVLVMEEAHTFIKRYYDDAENQNSAAICCQVFEKIAREGRKFGLGLVLSSQRPSELSPTVLSQCNSYLLHRISNDRDQELVHKLVPDNLRGLLRDLPSLPSRNAILLGWASELPVLVQMNSLPKDQRPKSDDPDFWAVWSGEGLEESEHGQKIERSVDWQEIATDWQQTGAGEANQTPLGEAEDADAAAEDDDIPF